MQRAEAYDTRAVAGVWRAGSPVAQSGEIFPTPRGRRARRIFAVACLPTLHPRTRNITSPRTTPRVDSSLLLGGATTPREIQIVGQVN